MECIGVMALEPNDDLFSIVAPLEEILWEGVRWSKSMWEGGAILPPFPTQDQLRTVININIYLFFYDSRLGHSTMFNSRAPSIIGVDIIVSSALNDSYNCYHNTWYQGHYHNIGCLCSRSFAGPFAEAYGVRVDCYRKSLMFGFWIFRHHSSLTIDHCESTYQKIWHCALQLRSLILALHFLYHLGLGKLFLPSLLFLLEFGV